MAHLLDSAPVRRFDDAVDGAFEHLRGRPLADRLLYAASEAGNFSVVWHLCSLALALLGGARGRRHAARLSATLAVESILVNGLLKSLTRRSRPAPITEHPHSLRTPRTSSFPSGHASAGACAAVLLSDATGHRWWWAAAATVVAASRVHVGQHHASDLVAGAAVGAAIGAAARKAAPLA